MISFAQNYEDVILWRSLSTVSTGFYIDVGAFHPENDSVTKWFYDQGWSGINIEPSRGAFAVIDAARPRDTNLCLAVGLTEQENATFFEFPGTGLSTLRPAVALNAVDIMGTSAIQQQVPIKDLTSILNVAKPEEIHFLKIDVEGAEADVLGGMDFQRYRPWIVLVEAVSPHSLAPTESEWESLLLAHGYEFVYFDGLNRFYVSDERAEEFAPNFALPPNCFDNFVQKIALPDESASDSEKLHHGATLSLIRERLYKFEARAEQERGRLIKISEVVDGLAKAEESRDHWRLSVMHRLESLQAAVTSLAIDQTIDATPGPDNDDVVVALKAEVASLNEQLAAIERSLSWRVTDPLRKVVSRTPFLARYVAQVHHSKRTPSTMDDEVNGLDRDELPIPLVLAPERARAVYELMTSQGRSADSGEL